MVDCGALLPARNLRRFANRAIASLGMQAMEKMDYAVMNLGREDFSLGADFVKNVSANITFPFVTSNIVYRKNHIPFGQSYVVIKVKDVNVGILGIIPEDAFENLKLSQTRNMLEIIPPEKTLANLIPAVKKEADIIVLLSQCGLEATRLIVNKLDGVSLAIVGEGENRKSSKKELPRGNDLKDRKNGHDNGEKTLLLQVAQRGHSLGFARLTLNEADQITQQQVKMIPIDSSITPDEKIVAVTGGNIYKKLSDTIKKIKKTNEIKAAQVRLETEREIEKFRNLSPEEYIQLQLEKRSKVGGEK